MQKLERRLENTNFSFKDTRTLKVTRQNVTSQSAELFTRLGYGEIKNVTACSLDVICSRSHNIGARCTQTVGDKFGVN